MKLITLAAGLGNRVQINGSYLPKALMEVSGQPLIKWSVDSFHALKSQGILGQSDLVFVVRKSDCDDYGLAQYLYQTFGENVTIFKLDHITNGPAESAYLAIKMLSELGKILPNEPVILNDCDHYFFGDMITRSVCDLLNENVDTVQLFETSKDTEDLAWSFIREADGEIIEIVEKPHLGNLDFINRSRGLIGVYAFSKSRKFLELFEICDRKSSTSKDEIFVSSLLSEASKMKSFKITRIFVDYFVSMGTSSKINAAKERLVSSSRLKEPSTIFVDLDGTIVLHDKGLFSDTGAFKSELIGVDEIELQVLRDLWNDGNQIIITTARPQFERSRVILGLSELGIKYDQLIMGITGGTRYLVNDSKDSVPGFATAIAVQVNRDKPELSSLKRAISEGRQLVIEHEYSGESGERTLLMNMQGVRFVRKISQSSKNSRELINYQSRWMNQVTELLPANLPRILDSYESKVNHQSFFDMEYLPGLDPLGERISKSDEKKGEDLIKSSVQILNKIYDTFRAESNKDFSYLVEVIRDKAVTGYKVALDNLGFGKDEQELPLIVNNLKVSNILTKLDALIESPKPRFLAAIHGNQNVETLIHGDPTLSNLVVNDQNQIFLLDPIGTRVLPNYSTKEYILGRTHPFFDYTRIKLSLYDEYERWARDIQVEESSSTWKVSFERNPKAAGYYKTFDKNWNLEYSMNDPLISNLFYLTTLCRILPYKSKNKRSEAYYMLSLIQDVMNEIEVNLYE
jgi:dTDP-glucose pyrophosphorylase